MTDRTQPVLEAHGLSKSFAVRSHSLKRQRRLAVADASFVLRAGASLGLIGESGSGKSTLAKLILGILEPDSGELRLCGKPAHPWKYEERHLFRHIQPVFQHPQRALNPRKRIVDLLEGPLRQLTALNAQERSLRIQQSLEQVGLDQRFLSRLPHQLSGGQAQRIAIARALCLNPEVLVFDEALASLDVLNQLSVLKLLIHLKNTQARSFFFISHDLGVVQRLCDDVLVMHQGRIVEAGPCATVLVNPTHPYTAELLRAAPRLC